MDIEENLQATVHRLALNLQATEQALSEAKAELAHCRPVADAAHAYAAAFLAGNDISGSIAAWNAVLAAHRATTPSAVPSSHVIVERAELQLLRAIATQAQAYADVRDRDPDGGAWCGLLILLSGA